MGLDKRSRPPSAAFAVAGHDAPLIGARAPACLRIAMEGRDEPPGEPNSVPPSAFFDSAFLQKTWAHRRRIS